MENSPAGIDGDVFSRGAEWMEQRNPVKINR
jgi:hypothetical protein